MIAPTLPELISMIIEARLANVNTSEPAAVIAYDRATQTCTAQPLIAELVVTESGEPVPEIKAPLQNVPVVFHGSGNNGLTWDLKRGDTVLLVYAHRSIDQWAARGGHVNPDDVRMHDHNDAFAIPGARARAQSIPSTGYRENSMVLRFDGTLRVGAAAAGDGSVRLSDITKIATALTSAIETLVTTPILGSSSSIAAAIDVAIVAATSGPLPDPQTVITLGFLKAALLVDPAVGALEALKQALEALQFPSASTRVTLE